MTRGSRSEMSSDSRESLDHRDPPCFLSLNTSLDIKTVISKVSDIYILNLFLYADSDSDYEEEVRRKSDKDLDNDH